MSGAHGDKSAGKRVSFWAQLSPTAPSVGGGSAETALQRKARGVTEGGFINHASCWGAMAP